MAKSFPYLAMDSAGERTILCDYPIKMFDNTTKEKKAKMAHVMTNQEVQSHTKKLVSRLLGQDAAMDDETAEKLKAFLQSKLHPSDHAAACALIDGGSKGEPEPDPAEDESGLPKNATVRLGGAAADAASFNTRFPGLSHVRLDNSGIAIPKRAAAPAADVASFNARFPGLAHIKQL